MDSDSDNEPLAATHRSLVAAGVIEPLATDDDDVRRWLDWELASLVEGHFHAIVDMGTLPPIERRDWEQRVLASRDATLRDPRRDQIRHAYWLLEHGERVGTLGLESMRFGRDEIGLSSLYVRPDCRGRGMARRTIDVTYDVAIDAGMFGVRVDTHWCWQPAARFYLHLGFWVRSWKHQLGLVRSARLPRYRVVIDGSRASFCVRVGDLWTPLIEAERRGTFLGWTETAAYSAIAESSPRGYLARSTFALHLAVHAWPLVRSAEFWERRHEWCDIGMPEGLAYKIAVFEAVDREAGYAVRTVRIPGLDYDRA
jgi:GNAT superfamily N-acetyltransferase